MKSEDSDGLRINSFGRVAVIVIKQSDLDAFLKLDGVSPGNATMIRSFARSYTQGEVVQIPDVAMHGLLGPSMIGRFQQFVHQQHGG